MLAPAQVMPLLRHVLGAANDKSHALLRAKCLECISLVGMAVGRDTFREDAHAVMQFMQSLQVHLDKQTQILTSRLNESGHKMRFLLHTAALYCDQ